MRARGGVLVTALCSVVALCSHPVPTAGMKNMASKTAKPLTAVDVVTCKMKGNKDKKDDCNPSCVCQKMAWSLEFNPQLRTATKTTQICEMWLEGGLIDKTCTWVCAGIANNLYGSQGTDPDVCAQAERELMQVSGGDPSKMQYKFIEQSEGRSREKAGDKTERTKAYSTSSSKSPLLRAISGKRLVWGD
eukprot:g5245.t1